MRIFELEDELKAKTKAYIETVKKINVILAKTAADEAIELNNEGTLNKAANAVTHAWGEQLDRVDAPKHNL